MVLLPTRAGYRLSDAIHAQCPLIGMCGKSVGRPASSSKHSACDRMIFMDLARRKASSRGSRAERRIRLSSAGLGRLPNVTYGRLLPARCQRSDRRVGTGHPPALMVSSVRPAPAARRRARASPHAFASGLIRSGPGPQRRAASGRMGTCPWPLTSSTPRSRPIGPGTSSGSCRNTPTTPPWCSSTARRCSWARR